MDIFQIRKILYRSYLEIETNNIVVEDKGACSNGSFQETLSLGSNEILNRMGNFLNLKNTGVILLGNIIEFIVVTVFKFEKYCMYYTWKQEIIYSC